jgi:glycosyltransferase involved in cell wall biosynthesis
MMAADLTSRNNLKVLAVLALPPPVHGQSIINSGVVRRLSANFSRLQVINTAPGSRNRNLKYHLGRASKVFKAVWALLWQPPFELRYFYTLLEAGSGIYYNFILIGVARCLGYRIILHQHSSAHTLADSRLFQFLTVVGGKEIIHVALSDSMAKDLKSRYVRVLHTVVCNNAGHIADPGPRSQRKMKGHLLVVGLLSNLNREKGLETFVDTLVAARTDGIGLKGVLAGPFIGDAAVATLERAQRLLGSALEVRGPVYDKEKTAFYRSIDVFFFPTEYIYEAQPLVVFEAMSYGIPVIATDRGYIAEMMGQSGMVIRPVDDVGKTVAQILKDFIQNPESLFVAGEASRTQFLTMHHHGSRELTALVNTIISSD